MFSSVATAATAAWPNQLKETYSIVDTGPVDYTDYNYNDNGSTANERASKSNQNTQRMKLYLLFNEQYKITFKLGI